MKIVLIGPVYPFVGGISHYTGLLARALQKKHEVHIVSFKMMYPKFLRKRAQRDYSDSSFKLDNVKYLINTASPFNILSVSRYINQICPDVVLIQWWHPYFAPCYQILTRHLDKKIKVFFTCHNVFPHERFPLDRLLTKATLKKGNAFIIHSKRDESDLLSLKKDAKHIYNPHPTYNEFKQRNISSEVARQEICSKDSYAITKDSKILLFFGFVREYKGLRYALMSIPEIAKTISDVKLLVVGSFGKDKESYIDLIKELKIENSVFLKDTYTPDNEVEKYFAASDLVVLPYIDATQSGIVQIAFGFEKPCVVTNVGGLPDVVTNEKTGYVIPPCDPSAISKAVIKYFSADNADIMQNNIRADSYRFSWDKMTESIEKLYES